MDGVDLHPIPSGKRLTPMEQYELLKNAAVRRGPPAVGTPEGEPPDCDNVNHPRRYTKGEVECIDAIDSAVVAKPPDEAVCVANIIKYLWRYEEKEPMRSLDSAAWYLDRLRDKVKRRYAT